MWRLIIKKQSPIGKNKRNRLKENILFERKWFKRDKNGRFVRKNSIFGAKIWTRKRLKGKAVKRTWKNRWRNRINTAINLKNKRNINRKQPLLTRISKTKRKRAYIYIKYRKSRLRKQKIAKLKREPN